MRAVLSFLSLLTLVFVFLVVANESSKDDLARAGTPGPRNEAVVAAPAAADLTATPAAAPDANRLGPETTLVEVATGRTVRLGHQNDVVIRFGFSNDGRWLIYDKGPPPLATATTAIYKIDLASQLLRPERLTDGFYPHPSPDGRFIAFTRRAQDEQQSSVYVLHDQGTERALEMPGTAFSLSWSPDSRWLSYNEGYQGEGQRMATILVDTQTWEQRIVGYTLPCNCDAPYAARWSSTSRYFIYPYDEAGGNRLVSVEDWSSSLLAGGVWWAPDAEILYIIQQASGEQPYTYNFLRHEVETGSTTALLSDDLFHVGAGMSPDGSRFAATLRITGSYGAGTMKVIGSDGSVQLDGIDGAFSTWSPDGRYILAYTVACDRGIAVLSSRDGSLVRCFAGGIFGTGVEISPIAPIAAHVVSTPIGPVRGPRAMLTNDVFLVDLVIGRERKLLSDVRGPMQCLEWSPDGKWLILDDWCDGI